MGLGDQPGYRRATVVGGGVIGISWTALFLAHGLQVTVCDPLPEVAERVRAGLREIAPTLAQLGLPVGDLTDGTDALRFEPAVASAVAGSDVVQENGPERQVLSREVPGFVANRLQAALFREAVHLVAQGVVTEQQLDAVVTGSIGMRWAVAGPFQTFHLGGGPGGLADFIVHLGPATEALWAVLGQASFDADTTGILTTQAENFDGTVAELAARRDEAQIRLMRALDEIGAAQEQGR